jgi:hypothetical protein
VILCWAELVDLTGSPVRLFVSHSHLLIDAAGHFFSKDLFYRLFQNALGNDRVSKSSANQRGFQGGIGLLRHQQQRLSSCATLA